jgi:hypothetical protein
MSFQNTVGSNQLVVGGIAAEGLTALRNVNASPADGVAITTSNPTGPLHYSGLVGRLDSGVTFQLELHMSPGSPCKVRGSLIPVS